MIRVFACTGALIAAASIANAATTLNFDDLSDGTHVTDQYKPLGVVFTGNLLVVGPSAFTNPVSAPNSVVFYDPGNGTSNYTLRADFVLPGTDTPGTTDFVAFTPTDASEGGTLFELRAYDSSDAIIGSASRAVDSAGVYDSSVDTEVSLSVAGIAYVQLIVSHANQVNKVIEGDNFRFNEPIPAPGAIALLAVAGVSAGRRRRR